MREKRKALETLSRFVLLDLVNRFQIPVDDTHCKQQLVNALAEARGLSLRQLLCAFPLGALREVCLAHDEGPPPHGRGDLVERVLSLTSAPHATDAPTRPGVVASGARTAGGTKSRRRLDDEPAPFTDTPLDDPLAEGFEIAARAPGRPDAAGTSPRQRC